MSLLEDVSLAYLVSTESTLLDATTGDFVAASFPAPGTESVQVPRGVLVTLAGMGCDELVLTPERARRIGDALRAAADEMDRRG